jgi:decaprenyl-phosphate phosphoribosyltransferase
MIKTFRGIFVLSRPRQISKNLLVILPATVSGEIFTWLSNGSKYLELLTVLICFSIASIIVYILNDILDFQNDKKNPQRINRPLVSGKVNKKAAVIYACILSITLLLLLISSSNSLVKFIFTYITINFFYSVKLKQIKYWEIIAVSSGYVLRALAGATIVDSSPSQEFYLFILFFSIAIVASKRMSELIASESIYRTVLRSYTKESLIAMYTISITISLYAYSSFIFSLSTNNKSSFALDITSIASLLVLIIIFFEFTTISFKGLVQSPEDLLKSNRFIQFNVLLFVISTISIGILR